MSVIGDIAELGASLFRRGLTFGRTGNLSALDADGTVVMTPTGVALDRLRPGGLSRVSLDGRHIGGPPPTKEAFLHLAFYRARPNAGAVVHTHSTHSGGVVSARRRPRQRAAPPDRLLRDARWRAAAVALPRPG